MAILNRNPRTQGLVGQAILVVLALCLPGGSAKSQEDDDETFRPGLIGRYTDAENRIVERVDRSVSFSGLDSSADRRLAPGKLRVQWRGFLKSQANGRYQVHAFVAGKLRVTLTGQTILDASSPQAAWHSSPPMELSFDNHKLHIEYEQGIQPAQIALYWSGPQFQLEPIDARQLFHDRRETPANPFERGESLVRALRCAACHEIPGESSAIPAPSLDRLSGSLYAAWVVDWLKQSPDAPAQAGEELLRRMPHFGLTADEAQAVTAYLFAQSLPRIDPPVQPEKRKTTKRDGKSKKKKTDEPEVPPKTPVESGQELVLTVGCLACHRVGEFGGSGLFGGGDLSLVAQKRPVDFFARWLAAPDTTNSQHRMPVFDLNDAERRDIAAYLATLGTSPPQSGVRSEVAGGAELVARGQQLFTKHRCGACHRGPEGTVGAAVATKSRLSAASNWDRACTGPTINAAARGSAPNPLAAVQPHYGLSDANRLAVREFIAQLHPRSAVASRSGTLMAERNCLACHARDESPGLAAQLTRVAQRHSQLAPLVPSMTPPPLASVGDKLHSAALRDAIRRAGPSHRPYLLVRMPKFPLTDAELDGLVDWLQTSDRIPAHAPGVVHPEDAAANRSRERPEGGLLLDAVGSRLVTPDGFGCTSCHQVGSVMPVKAPLNARGPDLSMLGQRIRREWYDRWVRNPARIVPRMEMPSVQIAVRGVLSDDVDSQLAAVWDVLNRPGFQPPQPNPVRTVRHSGTRVDQRAYVITDVLRSKQGTFIKPLLIGLTNRHNILFDLETARLAAWSIGDVAWQRTEGKSWYWEMAGKDLFGSTSTHSDLAVRVDGKEQWPRMVGQFATEFDVIEHHSSSLKFRYRLQFEDARSASTRQLVVTQTVSPLASESSNTAGFRRVLEVTGPAGVDLSLRLTGDEPRRADARSADGRSLQVGPPGAGTVSLRLAAPMDQQFQADGSVHGKIADANRPMRWEIDYLTDLTLDRFPLDAPPSKPPPPTPLQVVPGFAAARLPLSEEIMPTGLAWRPDGTLLIASLKGQVWLARDGDGDGLAEQLQPFSDDLAAPYGLYATAEYVDVINKYALVRLFDDDGDGRADRTVTAASGWGHTADYHDWAVGLPRDEDGNYFVAVPCQQDQRPLAAAHFRGAFLRLAKRTPSADDPRLFSVEPISRGHRFPMGIARQANGALFVTDNQGNYNPFNELNHIRPGAHFGFINALEKSDDPRPPLTPPSINIPHPWTRSVNGICFLDTPPQARQKLGRGAFGPWEGHLVGCEMDTRRLIRMSLQAVGDTYQGAAYPFSYDEPVQGPPLLGPLVCEVSPDGELFVGGLRDSGWGGSNNIGEVVRLSLQPEAIPNGITEVRANSNGFVVDFAAPVLADRATNTESYSLASYTRESTPAYGGPDVDRRTEKITAISLSKDARRVTLQLRELRPGYVYELHIKNLAAAGEVFFPAEAHYTLNAVPK